MTDTNRYLPCEICGKWENENTGSIFRYGPSSIVPEFLCKDCTEKKLKEIVPKSDRC